MGFTEFNNKTGGAKVPVDKPRTEIAGYTVEDYDGELSSTTGVVGPLIYIPKINEFTGEVAPFGQEDVRWDMSRQRFTIRKPVQKSVQ